MLRASSSSSASPSAAAASSSSASSSSSYSSSLSTTTTTITTTTTATIIEITKKVAISDALPLDVVLGFNSEAHNALAYKFNYSRNSADLIGLLHPHTKCQQNRLIRGRVIAIKPLPIWTPLHIADLTRKWILTILRPPWNHYCTNQLHQSLSNFNTLGQCTAEFLMIQHIFSCDVFQGAGLSMSK